MGEFYISRAGPVSVTSPSMAFDEDGKPIPPPIITLHDPTTGARRVMAPGETVEFPFCDEPEVVEKAV